MTPASPRRVFLPVIAFGLVALAVIAFLAVAVRPKIHHGAYPMKAETVQLDLALETCRLDLGHGQYPPDSTDDAEAVKQFLAKAFPGYHGGLPEKYKNLDPASSLVFWLGGMTDKDGKMIGFSQNPKNPFDTNGPRIGPFFTFAPVRLRNDGGLPVYLPPNADPQSDPFVYSRPDSKGAYHGAWGNCRPCRDSINGSWVNPQSFQLFCPGKDGKYGAGVEYPDGTDYDAQRKDDISNFTKGATLESDVP